MTTIQWWQPFCSHYIVPKNTKAKLQMPIFDTRSNFVQNLNNCLQTTLRLLSRFTVVYMYYQQGIALAHFIREFWQVLAFLWCSLCMCVTAAH